MIHRNQKQSGSDIVVIGEETYEALWAKTAADAPRRPNGPGWKNVAEIAVMLGIQVNSAKRRADANVTRKIWEKATGRNDTGHPCAFYRPRKDGVKQ